MAVDPRLLRPTMDTRRIDAPGDTQLASEDQIRRRLLGMGSGLFNEATEIPLWLLEKIMPADPMTPGELRSGSRDKIRAEQFEIKEFLDQMRQDPESSRGLTLGTGMGMVVNPAIDAPAALAPKLLKMAKAGKLTKVDDIIRILADETGALKKETVGEIKKAMSPRETKAKILREIKKAKREGYENIGIRIFHEDQNFKKGSELPVSYNWEDGNIDLSSPLDGTAAFIVVDNEKINKKILDEALSYSVGGNQRLGVVVGDRLLEHNMPEYGAGVIENALLFSDLIDRTPLKGVYDVKSLAQKMRK